MTSSDFSKQTLVFLSVLVLLVMALFPVVVIRLAIVTDVFTLHPSHTNGDFEANGNALHNSHSKALGWNETQSILSSGPPASSTATPEAPSTTSAPPSSSTASSVAQTALSSGPPASSTASPVSSVASEAKIRAHTGILMKKLIKASLQ